MITQIIDGISIKLDEAYQSEKNIYSENVEQGLEEPCFFIAVLNPSQDELSEDRSRRIHPFDIHYFPEVMGNNLEMNEVGCELYQHLKYITLINGDVLRGTSMRYEIIDDVLHFYVNFNLTVQIEREPEEAMEELTIRNN